MRTTKSSNEFFDIMDDMGDNKFVTIGYVTSANLNLPKVKRYYAPTKRTRTYDDFSPLSEDGEEIGAIVKISSYNMRYRKRKVIGDQYDEFKKSSNVIRGEYGLPPIADKENDYKEKRNFGGGVDVYNGNNDSLQGHSYNGQNVFNVKPKSTYYAVNTEGHIIKALTKEQIMPYLQAKKEVDGVSVLRKMGTDEERIKEYISRIKELKFQYRNFLSDSILWIAATVNGEKIVYINDNISKVVNEININKDDFIKIANERYQKDLQALQESNTHRNVIRITESDLRSLIEESVKRIMINESFKNNDNYSHFAVNKATGKIVNGWDYSDHEPSELRQFKKDYFIVDLEDYGLNPKDYKILTTKSLIRMGIDPDDNNNWAIS